MEKPTRNLRMEHLEIFTTNKVVETTQLNEFLQKSVSSRRKISPKSLMKHRIKKSLVIQTPRKIGQLKVDRRFTEEKRRNVDEVRIGEITLQGKKDQQTGVSRLQESRNENIKIVELPVTKSGAKFDSVLAKRRYCTRLEQNESSTSKANDNFQSPKLSSNFYGRIHFNFRILTQKDPSKNRNPIVFDKSELQLIASKISKNTKSQIKAYTS